MNTTCQWHLPEALLVSVEAAICCRRACLHCRPACTYSAGLGGSGCRRACLASGVSVIFTLAYISRLYLPEALLVWVEAPICCRRAVGVPAWYL